MKDYPFELAKGSVINQTIKKERGSPITCREWDSYSRAFCLPADSEYWNNKTLLDVGSGEKWHDPSRFFPGAKICAIDPEFGENGRVQWNTAHETTPGIVQDIPYRNNSFDHVISSHAVPQHIFPVDMPIAVLEMLRVVKPSGDVRLAPCVPGDIFEIGELLKEIGFEIDFSQDGCEGQIAIIKAGPDIQNQEIKDESLNKIRISMGLTTKNHG